MPTLTINLSMTSESLSVKADPIPVDLDEDELAKAAAVATAIALQKGIEASGHWVTTGRLLKGIEAQRVAPGQYAVTKPADRLEAAAMAQRFDLEVGESAEQSADVDAAIEAALEEMLRMITKDILVNVKGNAAQYRSELGSAGNTTDKFAKSLAGAAEQLEREKKLLEQIHAPAKQAREDFASLEVLHKTGQISSQQYTTELDRMMKVIRDSKSPMQNARADFETLDKMFKTGQVSAQQYTAQLDKMITSMNTPKATSKFSAGLQSMGLSMEQLGGGLKEMGKGVAMRAIQDGVSGITAKLTEMTGVPIGGSGTALGFMVGGAYGAAIGGLGEALGGLLHNEFDQHIQDQAAAAQGYLLMAHAMDDVDSSSLDLNGDQQLLYNAMRTSFKAADDYKKKLEETKKAADELNPALGLMNKLLGEGFASYTAADTKVRTYAAAVLKLNMDKLTAISNGLTPGVSADEIRITRGARDAQLELNAANSSYGKVLVEVKGAENARLDRLADLKKMLGDGVLKQREYNAEVAKMNPGGSGTSRAALRDAHFALDTWRVDEGSNNQNLSQESKFFFSGPTSLGKAANTTPLDEFGRPIALDTQGPLTQKLTANWNEQIAKQQGQKNGLEAMFGKPEQINAYATAFNGLTTAVTSSLDAWIDGSESAGKAFKHAVGDQLKALAGQMIVEGLKNEAYAIASLVPGPFFNPGAAAGYAAAGAAFLAGGALAAVTAKELGTSASASSAAKGGGGASAPTSYSSSGGGSGMAQYNITYGDAFADDSPRGREAQARRIVSRALGNNAVSYN